MTPASPVSGSAWPPASALRRCGTAQERVAAIDRHRRDRLSHRLSRIAACYHRHEHPRRVVRNRLSAWGGRLTVRLRPVAALASWALLALTFVEPPAWCRDASALLRARDGPGDCRQLLAARGAGEARLYPSSGVPRLTSSAAKRLELACASVPALHLLCAFAADGFSPRLFFRLGSKKGRVHAARCLGLVGLVTGTAAGRGMWNPALRPLILATYLRKLRRELKTLLQVVSGCHCSMASGPAFSQAHSTAKRENRLGRERQGS